MKAGQSLGQRVAYAGPQETTKVLPVPQPTLQDPPWENSPGWEKHWEKNAEEAVL